MAQQGVALGGAAAGALAGSLIPGVGWVIGAQIGFAAGSVAGSLLFPQKGPKPQKEDLTVQAASYGVPISELSGTDEKAADVMLWCQGNALIRKKVDTGGKGLGGMAGPATYEYFISAAFLIGNGPIDGILQIKCDTKLEHDASDQRLEDVLANGGQTVTSLHAIDSNIRIYLGTEDQMPDPLIQADRGIDNVSAFRGQAYFVVEELPLRDFGNRCPNFRVVYVKDGTLVYRSITPATSVQGLNITFDPYGPYIWYGRLGPNMIKFNTVTREVELNVNVEAQLDSNGNPIAIFAAGGTPDEFGNLYVAGLGVDCYKFDALTLAYIAHTDVWGGDSVHRWHYHTFNAGTTRWLGGLNDLGNLRVIDPVAFQGVARSFDVGSSEFHAMSPDKVFWCVQESGSLLYRVELHDTPDPDGSAPNGEYWPYTLTTTDTIDLSATFGGSLNRVAYYADEDVLLLAGGGTLAKFDMSTLAITATVTGVGEYDESEFMKGPWNGKLWGLSGQTFVEADVASMAVTRSFARTLWSGISSRDGVAYDHWSDSLIARPLVISNDEFSMLFLPRIDPLDVDRADVITQYCELVGLTSSQIDVSAVVDTIKGYTTRRQTTARDALEPVLQSGFVDSVDVDRKIRFLPRPQPVTVTITEDELGAALFGQSDSIRRKPVEQIPQELTKPERVYVLYTNPEGAYDKGSQVAKRSRALVRTREQFTFDTPEPMLDDTAMRIAERLLLAFWVEYPVTLTLALKYDWLCATDVLVTQLASLGLEFRIRVEKINLGPYLEIEGRVEEPATYTSTATGGPSNIPNQVLQLLSPTQLFLIDSNLLRDEDDNGGHYVAGAPTVPDGLWPGFQIFKSSDAVSFAPTVSYDTAVDWGVAEGALAPHHCTTTDRYNTLIVRMVRDQAGLASCTEDDLNTGANAFLLQSGDDWEIIQAADITDLGGGRYRLATMLRGRRGTEQAAAGHIIGDKLIVLSTATMQRLVNESEVDQERYYKAVTWGATFNPVGAVPFTNTARGRECYAPEHMQATRDGSNNITFTWSRRSRIGDEIDWTDNIAEPPLGEASEAYQLAIVIGGTEVRVITASSETAPYSAANQSTDGITPGNPVSGFLYQMSAVNGRGRPLAFTL